MEHYGTRRLMRVSCYSANEADGQKVCDKIAQMAFGVCQAQQLASLIVQQKQATRCKTLLSCKCTNMEFYSNAVLDSKALLDLAQDVIRQVGDAGDEFWKNPADDEDLKLSCDVTVHVTAPAQEKEDVDMRLTVHVLCRGVIKDPREAMLPEIEDENGPTPETEASPLTPVWKRMRIM